MITDSYPFKFVHRHYDCSNGINYIDVYRFKSTKSNLTYFINVERYEYNMYVVKFYQKNHKLSSKKYQILSNTFEPRRMIYTCMNVMLSVLEDNPHASFGFIGANSEGEDTANTKRYRVYNKVVASKISSEQFKHIENVEKSAYMLINREELAKHPDLVERIEESFVDLYDFFE